MPVWLASMLASLAAAGLTEAAARLEEWWRSGAQGPAPLPFPQPQQQRDAFREEWDEDPLTQECRLDRLLRLCEE